ncbi:hypothetical protein TI05_09100 [Achromatium sp. WMS3]|nr:hypothetical protein TI05_09100 [Achromatium sp. WMS3]
MPIARLNIATKKAFSRQIRGYTDSEKTAHDRVCEIVAECNIKEILRFDLGQNPNGCAPEVAEKLQYLSEQNDAHLILKNYPGTEISNLRDKLANMHGISPDQLLFSAGTEQMIGLIARSILEEKDSILVNRPSFFVFENVSNKMGAHILHLDLNVESGFNWTEQTLERFKVMQKQYIPKIIWIANPNNPTGQAIADDILEEILRFTANYPTLVVIDEAYGEYLDPPNGFKSISQIVPNQRNLLVLRTFSKAYGLASIRLGYAITSDENLSAAIRLHSNAYPVSELSIMLANFALNHMDYLEQTRQETIRCRKQFLEWTKSIPKLEVINSDCSILMLKHKHYDSITLRRLLEKLGIFTSSIPGSDEIAKSFIRISLGRERENRILYEQLRCI